MRLSRGPDHGNVSLVHIQLEVKKDMNQRKLDFAFSHIASYSFIHPHQVQVQIFLQLMRSCLQMTSHVDVCTHTM